MFGKKLFQNMENIKLNKDMDMIDEDVIVKETTNNESSISLKFDLETIIKQIKNLENHTIKPYFDISINKITYPFLEKIGEDITNENILSHLEKEGILEKQIHEKFIVCPQHPNSFVSNVRMYCPSCKSMNIERLSLYEHKKCGNITETKLIGADIKICEHCKREIIDFEKECRIPAMWYKCQDCIERFDNATIKLHCREHKHDFDMKIPTLFTAYSYILKDKMTGKLDSNKLKKDVSKILERFKIESQINASLEGKSGNYHDIPIYGKSLNGKTDIMLFVFQKDSEIDDSDINKILITVLDLEPMITIIVTSSKIKTGTQSIIEKYNIKLIQSEDSTTIKTKIEKILSPS